MVTGERKPIGIGLKRRLSKKGVGMYNISLDYDIMVALNSDMQVFNKMADELQNSVENKETININDIEERLKTLSFKAILDFITNDSHLSYDKDKKSLLGGLMEVLKNGEDQS
jgi:hypothetical protein